MMNIKKILLPVDFPLTALRVIHQAATLAGHFHAEIVLLHVATKESEAAGVPKEGMELGGWDMGVEILREAQKKGDESLSGEMEGLTIRRLLIRGDTTEGILQTAGQEKADLVMMPSHGPAFDRFLVSSVTPKMVEGIECPVWNDSQVEESRVGKFAIGNVLCAVDFKQHSHRSAVWAARIAAEFGARLTLAHVTAGVEFWGPGGRYVNQEWKAALVGDASRRMAELLRETGIQAEVFIGSGNVPKVLNQAAQQTKADLLVTGCQPYGGYLRTHGYAIITEMSIPVLSV
jgi:nucleotide-binding universal stress UspA family protein